MKKLAERVLEPLDTSGFLGLLEGFEHDNRRLRVLTYHRVAELDATPDLEPGLISATPAGFRAEMELLAQSYAPISLVQLLEAHAGRTPLPERAVLVTFDDGYRDFADTAWPILRELGIPVTLFVPTAFPDGDPGGFWWDRLHAALRRTRVDELTAEPFGRLAMHTGEQRRDVYKRVRNHVKSMPHTAAMAWLDGFIEPLAELPPLNNVLGWAELRRLAAEGVSVCSHGQSHALMTRLTGAELAAELTESLERIRSEMGAQALPPVLAYPSNAADESVRGAVGRAGYILAFGGRRGMNRLPLRHALELRRMPVLRYQRALFRAQLRPSLCAAGGALTAMRGRLRA